jgi:Tfp pilus assembly protein PilX
MTKAKKAKLAQHAADAHVHKWEVDVEYSDDYLGEYCECEEDETCHCGCNPPAHVVALCRGCKVTLDSDMITEVLNKFYK